MNRTIKTQKKEAKRELQAEITLYDREISRRMDEFIADKRRLPYSGKNSRLGHLQQIADKSIHLEKLKREA